MPFGRSPVQLEASSCRPSHRSSPSRDTSRSKVRRLMRARGTARRPRSCSSPAPVPDTGSSVAGLDPGPAESSGLSQLSGRAGAAGPAPAGSRLYAKPETELRDVYLERSGLGVSALFRRKHFCRRARAPSREFRARGPAHTRQDHRPRYSGLPPGIAALRATREGSLTAAGSGGL
jgi:hypothetical protein